MVAPCAAGSSNDFFDRPVGEFAGFRTGIRFQELRLRRSASRRQLPVSHLIYGWKTVAETPAKVYDPIRPYQTPVQRMQNFNWFTRTRIVILALATILVMLVAYQSILAQTLNRPTLQTAPPAVVKAAASDAADQTKSYNKTDTPQPAAVELEARALDDKGNFAESEKLYRKALGIDEKSLGVDNPALVPVLRGLGNSLARQKKLADAEKVLTRLVELENKNFADADQRKVQDLTSLGSVYLEAKKVDQARELFDKALAISKTNFGPNSLEVAVALNNLAMFNVEQKQDAKAFDLYERANGIAADKKYWMSNDAGLIKTNSKNFWNGLKQQYISNEPNAAGKFPQAELKQASDLSQKGDYKKAEEILTKNLDAAVKAPGSKLELAKYLVRFNNVLFHTGKDEDAVMYGRIAAQILDDPQYADDKAIVAWRANLHSFLAMSADRQSLNDVPARAYLLSQSQANYNKALSLCATAGVEERWTRMIKTGLASVNERKSPPRQRANARSIM